MKYLNKAESRELAFKCKVKSFDDLVKEAGDICSGFEYNAEKINKIFTAEYSDGSVLRFAVNKDGEKIVFV